MFQEIFKYKIVQNWIHYFPQIADPSLWVWLYSITSSSYQYSHPTFFIFSISLIFHLYLVAIICFSISVVTHCTFFIHPHCHDLNQVIITSTLQLPCNWSPKLQSLALTLLPDFFQQYGSKLEMILQYTEVLYLTYHSRTFKMRNQPTYLASSFSQFSQKDLNCTLLMICDSNNSHLLPRAFSKINMITLSLTVNLILKKIV